MKSFIFALIAVLAITGCSKKDDGGGSTNNAGPGGGPGAPSAPVARKGVPANLNGTWSGPGKEVFDGKTEEGTYSLSIQQNATSLIVTHADQSVEKFEIKGNDLILNGKAIGTIGADGASLKYDDGTIVRFDFANDKVTLYVAGTAENQDGKKSPFTITATLSRQ